ncbi:MAG: DUF3576 domain-containing protein [Azospirillaceae bacterium]|nr:DUF3576 domain-containing protein [Azospirillaceae bacterium]
MLDVNSRTMGRSKVALLLILTALGGCSSWGSASDAEKSQTNKDDYKFGSLTGDEGITLFAPKKRQDAEQNGGIGVNSFLWRATLDTIAFMPVASADPFGGVILTDWYSAPETPNARFKVNIYILDRQLRADGLRVSVFRQEKDNSGWHDVTVSPDTAAKLEDSILTRARQLRVSQTATPGS